jgi:hypothetical protein
MFVATNTPLPKGCRVRVEVTEAQKGFVLEGVVVRSSKIRPEFRAVRVSGMGIRFLPVDELLGHVLGPQVGLDQNGSEQAEEEASAPGTYRVVFASRDDFLAVYQRDLASGGLFISTQEPAGMDDVVTAELVLPWSGLGPQSFPARVVHRLEPQGALGPNLMAGMGVQFVDPDAVLRALSPLTR